MEVFDLTWEALKAPLALALATSILMLLLLKPTVVLLFDWLWARQHRKPGDQVPPTPDPWPLRSLVVNLVTFGVALTLAAWRLKGEHAGQVFVLALVAFAGAVGAYEPIKNALRAVGIDIAKFNWLS